MEEAALNTDIKLWQQPTTNYGPDDGNDSGMEPYVFVTKDGKIGFNHYGTCAVKTIEEWVKPHKSMFERGEMASKPITNKQADKLIDKNSVKVK